MIKMVILILDKNGEPVLEQVYSVDTGTVLLLIQKLKNYMIKTKN